MVGEEKGGRGKGREGAGGELTAPLPEADPPTPPRLTGPAKDRHRSEGWAPGAPRCRGGGHDSAGAPRLSLPIPNQPSLHQADPSSRSLIPRCGNRTLEQVVTPAPRPAPRAALETSATSVTKPRHPPRPHGEHGKPSPTSLSSALGHPLPAAPHTPP